MNYINKIPKFLFSSKRYKDLTKYISFRCNLDDEYALNKFLQQNPEIKRANFLRYCLHSGINEINKLK